MSLLAAPVLVVRPDTATDFAQRQTHKKLKRLRPHLPFRLIWYWISSSEFLPRTKKDHDEHCASLLVSELKEHFSWLYGLNNSSIFNSLKYFHVIGGLAPDIMHDVLEGIIPLQICLVLSQCRAKKYITLSALNCIIKNFKYGHANARDKPPPITSKHLSETSLPGSATQNGFFL